MKKIVIISSIIVIILGGYFAFKGISNKENSLYGFEEVKKGEIIQTVSVTGTVIPAKQIDLQFETQGKISKVYKKTGDQASSGEILISLNTSELNAQYQSAKAGLDIAQAKLDQTLAGNRPEDIQVYQTAVENAEVDLINKEKPWLTRKKMRKMI